MNLILLKFAWNNALFKSISRIALTSKRELAAPKRKVGGLGRISSVLLKGRVDELEGFHYR